MSSSKTVSPLTFEPAKFKLQTPNPSAINSRNSKHCKSLITEKAQNPASTK